MQIGRVHVFEHRTIVGFDSIAEETGRSEEVIDFLDSRGYKLVQESRRPDISTMAVHFYVAPPIADEDYRDLNEFCASTFDDDLPSGLKLPVEHMSSYDRRLRNVVQLLVDTNQVNAG